MATTLEELKAELAVVKAQLVAAQESQSYSNNGKTLTRGAIQSLRDERSRLETAIYRMEKGTCSRVPEFVTRDEE